MSDIIISVSGVRGITGDSLTPDNIVKYTSAFSQYLKNNGGKNRVIAVGRDGRSGGDIVESIVTSTLAMAGFDTVNIGVAPTPTVQLATEMLKASGGISITASHNPQEWNGLKFLNPDGTFLEGSQVDELIRLSNEKFDYVKTARLGIRKIETGWIKKHVDEVLKLDLLDVSKIRKRKFKVVVDAVNSSGSVIVPMLLNKLGCTVVKLFCDGSGKFPHTPEPLPQNLKLLSSEVRKKKADLGIAVDPDADRLVLINGDGEPIVEENTIVIASRFVLKQSKQKSRSVTVNLSTTRGVEDVAAEFNAKVFRSPVGEINVVKEMKKSKSIIGGEGSGGVIYPGLHYGRDSLVAIALVLNELADFKGKTTEYVSNLPQYFISKTKIENVTNADEIFARLQANYSESKDVTGIRTDDGLKIDFKDHWVHMRKSNTEPIVRIITEAKSKSEAEKLQSQFSEYVLSIK